MSKHFRKFGVVVLVSFTALAAITFILRAQPSAGLGVAIACDVPTYNFGTIPAAKADNLEHTFIIKNITRNAIHLKQPTTSCGCTVANLLKTKIESGEQAEVKVSAKWGAKAGRVTERVTVAGEEAGFQPLMLTLSGEITVSVAALPSYINFGEMYPDETKSREIRIESQLAEAPKITTVDSSCPFFSVKNAQNGDMLSSYLITVKAPSQSEIVDGVITFNTSNAVVLKVLAHAEFMGSFTVKPSVVLFSGGETGPETIHVVARYNRSGAINLKDLSVILATAGHEPLPFTISSPPKIGKEPDEFNFDIKFDGHNLPTLADMTIKISYKADTMNIPVQWLPSTKNR